MKKIFNRRSEALARTTAPRRSQLRPFANNETQSWLTRLAAEAGAMPTHERLGTDNCEDLQDRRKPAIQLDKNQRSLFVSQTRPCTLRRRTIN
jgi:hypothetical protein